MKIENNFAVILCGGKGSRLGNLGQKYPKTLLKIQKKEILWYIITFLKKFGFKNIILPLGYKGEQIKNFLKKNNNFNINIIAVNSGVNSNIGSRLNKIKNKIKSKNFLLLNGDAIFDENIKKIYSNHLRNNNAITFLSSEFTYPYGTIGTINNKVVDFKRNLVFDAIKTRRNSVYLAYNYTGISIINTKIFLKNSKIFNSKDNFEQSFYPRIISNNKCSIVKINGFWHSVDNVKDLYVVNNPKTNEFKKTKKLKKFLI